MQAHYKRLMCYSSLLNASTTHYELQAHYKRLMLANKAVHTNNVCYNVYTLKQSSNKAASIQKAHIMYAMQVLNGGDEWELIVHTFETEAAAVAFFEAELSMFDDYCIFEMQSA